MANRYWVGGTASWDGTAGTKWALTSGGAGGQAVPTTADDVFFDANSGTSTVTVATGNTGAKSITCTGFTGTLNVTVNLTVAGNITLVGGMTFTQSTGTVTVSVTAASTITSAGKSFHRLTVNAPSATVQLADALSCGSFGTLTVTAGTFTTNSFSVTAFAFDSSNTNTRTINLGGSTVTLSSSGAGGAGWSTFTATNLTFNAGTSTINFTGADAQFYTGAINFNNVTFSSNATGTVGNSILTQGTPAVNGTLTFTAPASTSISYIKWGGNISAATLVASGASAVRRLNFRSDTLGTARTLTVTTWSTISDIDFRDITMNTSRSGTRLGDCGGNTNITFSAAKTVYWNLAGTQNWSATGWATTSGGSPSINNFPLAQDTAVFDNSGSASTVTIETAWSLGAINATSRTTAITLTFTSSVAVDIYGSFNLGSGVTLSGSGVTQFSNRSTTVDITPSGKNIPFSITVQAISGTVRLMGAYSSNYNGSSAIGLNGGTFNVNGYTVTLSASSAGFSALAGSLTRVLAMGTNGTLLVAGTGGIDLSGANLTITGSGTFNLTSSSGKTFAGGSRNYANFTVNQGGGGTLTFTGANTFGDITNTYSATGATSILFTAGTTTTFNSWSASGSVGKLLTIGSVTAASHTLSKSSGIVSADYLSVSRSTATGGATWYAGANSTNGGNNTGWIFSAPPSPSANFFMFFNGF